MQSWEDCITGTHESSFWKRHRYIIFQMAEVAVPKELFQEILRLIAELRPQPPPAPA
jgi:hypothetical protein